MADLIDGVYLNTYLAPQLLQEYRNFKDDFLGVLGKAPKKAITADGIRMNKLINNVDLLINNSDPFTPKKMNFKKGIIEWDKLDTTPTSVDDSEVRALTTDKRAAVRVKHGESFRIGARNYVMNKLAPNQDANGMPVLRTTGEIVTDKTGASRRRLTYADLIIFWSIIEGLDLPNPDGFNLILCKDHVQDLILDRASTQNYRDIVIDKETGELKRFYTLKLWKNNHNPLYTEGGILKSLKAVKVPTDKNASIFFYDPNTVYHLDRVKILYKPETIDTRNAEPESEYRTQTYGLCDKTQEYGFGAIVSGNAA